MKSGCAGAPTLLVLFFLLLCVVEAAPPLRDLNDQLAQVLPVWSRPARHPDRMDFHLGRALSVERPASWPVGNRKPIIAAYQAESKDNAASPLPRRVVVVPLRNT